MVLEKYPNTFHGDKNIATISANIYLDSGVGEIIKFERFELESFKLVRFILSWKASLYSVGELLFRT